MRYLPEDFSSEKTAVDLVITFDYVKKWTTEADICIEAASTAGSTLAFDSNLTACYNF